MHRRYKREEKKETTPIHWSYHHFQLRCVSPRAASGGARGRSRRHCSCTVFRLAEGCPCNFRLFGAPYCNFNVMFVYLFFFEFLYFANMDVKEKKRKKKKKRKEIKKIVKVYVWVCICICFYECFYFYYDKIEKIKEEFNIFIGSRSRFINLYVSCISNFR